MGRAAEGRHMKYPKIPGHVAGSDTSEAAARSMDNSAGAIRDRIGVRVRAAGREGYTCDEIEVVMGLRHQTASARIRELVLASVLVDSGRRRPTRSGCNARVYTGCPDAWEFW